METKAKASGVLTRRECVEFLDKSTPTRVGMVIIAGAAPVAVACFVSPAGEVVIPTGPDRDLVRAAAGRPVTVEFEHSDRDSGQRWVVRGTGHARPLASHARPPAAVDTDSALAMLYAFENGIQVRLEHLSGQRVVRVNGGRVARP